MTSENLHLNRNDSFKEIQNQDVFSKTTQQTKESLKAQGVTKSKAVLVLKGVGGVAQSIGYIALGILTFPSAKTERHFICKSLHADYKVTNAISGLKLGKFYVFPLRNVTRSNIFNTAEEKEAAESLLKKCQNVSKEYPSIGIRNIPLKTASVDGVCMGFRLDAANDYLNSPEKTSEERVKAIADKNRKGVSKEAAAYQAAYSVLGLNYKDHDKYDKGLFQPIFQLESSGNEIKASDLLNSLFLLDRKARKQFLSLVSNEVQSDKASRYSKLLTKLEQKNKGAFTALIQEVISSNPQLLSSKGRINDLGEFKEAVKQAIEKRYKISDTESLESFSQQKTKDLNNLEWLISSLEVSSSLSPIKGAETDSHLKEQDKSANTWKSFTRFARRLFKSSSNLPSDAYISKVTNPSHRFFFESQYNSNVYDHAKGIIEQSSGIKSVSVDNIMGWPALHKSDDEFIEKLYQLPKGFYSIDLKTGPGSHAISYIKDEDDPSSGGWILDPNRGIFRCSNEKETVELLQKLVSLYDLPKQKNPLSLKNDDHQLSIQKLEKYSKPQTVQQDTNVILALCEKKANEGDVEWTMRLAKMYEEKKEMETAIAWYEKAAEQGNGKAMKALGSIYRYGKKGVEKNFLKASEWYEKAAALLVNEDRPLLELGVIYAMGGFGLEQSGKKAIEIGERVTERGNPRVSVKFSHILQNSK